ISAAAAERLRWYQRTRQSVQRPEHAARSGWHAAAPRPLALPVNGAGRRAGGRRSHRDLRRRCAMNATRGTLVRLAVLVTPALACNLDRVPTAPGTPIRAELVAAAGVSSFVCDVGGATWEGDADAAVVRDLAPSGVMRVAFNYNNRNNATRDPITGALTGPGIDMSCKLAQGTHAQFMSIPGPVSAPVIGSLVALVRLV